MDSVPQSQPMQAVMKLIEDLKGEYPIDQDRMYIAGISMGGYGTWDTIIRYPDTFAAAIPVCGAGDPTKAERIKDVSIWTFHSSDDSIVPISGTRDMVQALEAVGGDIQYTEYSGYGHESWEPAFNRPELLDWLFFHQKKSPMQSVDTLEPISVPYGTAFADLPLPDTVNVTLENGETRPAAITWNGQDAAGGDYDGNIPGTYTLFGMLTADGASNPQNLTASIQVTVEAQPAITDVINPEAITVPYGTAFADLPLPDTVTVQLSDGTQTTVEVLRWDTDGDPAYDGNVGQTYTLTGHLTETVPNPQNLTASIQVTVKARPADKGDIDGDGDVDIQDVMGACKILARKNAGDASTDDEIARGDLTGDGQVTIEDIMAICKILAQQSA